MLKKMIYQHVCIQVLVRDCYQAGTTQTDIKVDRLDHFLSDSRLRTAMMQENQWDDSEMKRRQELGDICYMVVDAGRCVHYSWVTQRLRYMKELGHPVSIPPKQAWIYDCRTLPSHRGRSIYPQTLTKIISDMKQQGGEIVWIDVEADNIPSLKGASKAGFTKVAFMEKFIFLSFFTRHRSRTLRNLENPEDGVLASYKELPFAIGY